MSPILMDLTPSTDGTFTATVVIAGIVIVVAVLFLLILIFQLFGVVAPKIDAAAAKREKRKAEKKAKINEKKIAETKSAAFEPAKSASVPVPAAEEGISEEIVAAISAAVAQLEGGSVVIRSIKKKNVGGRNPWANAANIENTKPF